MTPLGVRTALQFRLATLSATSSPALTHRSPVQVRPEVEYTVEDGCDDAEMEEIKYPFQFYTICSLDSISCMFY